MNGKCDLQAGVSARHFTAKAVGKATGFCVSREAPEDGIPTKNSDEPPIPPPTEILRFFMFSIRGPDIRFRGLVSGLPSRSLTKQMLICESAAGSRFEISLKCRRSRLVFDRNDRIYFPRPKL